ncbi:WbqC family protein [Flavobacterium sp. N2820]|uniref:WbqC family protein n=1 Tax=Flavobacterium sp. N2820 TaxID=2986834 RepID=UPI00222407E8|nr:WbqC family protein [Flavobacterium sp. N2820]
MKLAIMQPYFFPYIGYFQLINAVDKFIVYDDVNFIKGGWINRNNVLVSKKPFLFTVPLENSSSFIQIDQTRLHSKFYENWKIKFLKSLEQSYKKAPFYNEVFFLIEKILNKDNDFISTLAVESIKEVCNYLDVKTQIIETSKQYNNKYLNGQDRIISICQLEQAKYYINPIGGIDLYSKEDFKKNDIILNFIKAKPIEYKQFDNRFVSWLSIIDILMFNSKIEVVRMLNEYDLV